MALKVAPMGTALALALTLPDLACTEPSTTLLQCLPPNFLRQRTLSTAAAGTDYIAPQRGEKRAGITSASLLVPPCPGRACLFPRVKEALVRATGLRGREEVAMAAWLSGRR